MRKKRIFPILLALLVLLLGIELYRSNRIIDVEQIAISNPNLPDGFDGYRIAHLADLHGAQFGGDNAALAEMIREQDVDIIVFTGDYVDSTTRDLHMVYATARNLVEVAPVYFVPGNHEYSDGFAPVAAELERAGVTVMQNRAVELESGGDRIILLGIDDPNGYATMLPMDDTVELARRRDPDFILMLNHRYDRAEEASELDIDIMLAGHAHGGVVRLPFTDGLIGPGRVWFPKNTNGLYDINGMDFVASRGLGNSGISVRLFNPPHLPIIELSAE